MLARPGLGVTTLDQLVALGLLSEKRAAAAPEIPSVDETQSVKGVHIEIWAGLAGPPKLPPAVVDTLSRAAQPLLTYKAFIERRARGGDQTPPFESPADFGRFMTVEEQRYRGLAIGLKLE